MHRIIKTALLTGVLGLTACESPVFVLDKHTLISTNREVIVECNGMGTVFNSGDDTNRDGELRSDEVTTTDFVCDGRNGVDGLDSMLTGVVDPCGDGTGPDEVLLMMADGSVVAWYQGLGMSILNENTNYTTTDAQQCRFKIVNSELVEL